MIILSSSKKPGEIIENVKSVKSLVTNVQTQSVSKAGYSQIFNKHMNRIIISDICGN